MTRDDEKVVLVDDDFRVREALSEWFASRNIDCVVFASATEYLAHSDPVIPGCLILDLSLPDINGLELQSRIARIEHPPIIFITGHGDIPSSVQAMKAGAVDFLTKPLKTEDLMRAVRSALERDRERREDRAELAELRAGYATLTPRERDVFPLVVRGLLNKQAAAELGISEVTLQIHRSKVMKKMKAESLADLVRIALRLGIPSMMQENRLDERRRAGRRDR